METQIATRALDIVHGDDRLGSGFAGSLLLHIAIAALLLCWAWLLHAGQNWGEPGVAAGAIQATMVADIPLPPKQPINPDNVLATEAPSPAPITSKTHTAEIPQPNAIPIPTKSTKPLKTADKSSPAPPLHPQPIQVNPNQVQTGEATGSNLTMSSIQTRAGTNSGPDLRRRLRQPLRLLRPADHPESRRPVVHRYARPPGRRTPCLHHLSGGARRLAYSHRARPAAAAIPPSTAPRSTPSATSTPSAPCPTPTPAATSTSPTTSIPRPATSPFVISNVVLSFRSALRLSFRSAAEESAFVLFAGHSDRCPIVVVILTQSVANGEESPHFVCRNPSPLHSECSPPTVYNQRFILTVYHREYG